MMAQCGGLICDNNHPFGPSSRNDSNVPDLISHNIARKVISHTHPGARYRKEAPKSTWAGAGLNEVVGLGSLMIPGISNDIAGWREFAQTQFPSSVRLKSAT